MKSVLQQFSILITAIGSTGAQGVAKAFARQSRYPVRLIGCDALPDNGGVDLVERFYQVPVGDHENYVQDLKKICMHENVDLLIPVMELELVAVAGLCDLFRDHNPVISNSRALETCNDKHLTTEFLVSVGIPAPSRVADRSAEALPVIIKPRFGSGSRNVKVVRVIEHWPADVDPDRFVVEQYLCGSEYTVDAYTSMEGRFVGAVPRRRIAVKDGLSVQTITVEYPELIEYTEQIVTSLNLRGPVNIQFIEGPEGIPHCTDINPRFGGAYLASVMAGLDVPTYLLDELVGNPSEYTGYEVGLTMLRRWHEVWRHDDLV